MFYGLIEEKISNKTLKVRRKKRIFKHLSMFWLKRKQGKEKRQLLYEIFLTFYALSLNFMPFYDFNPKSELFLYDK